MKTYTTDEEIKKELIDYIKNQKATKLSAFKYYQACKSRFGGAQKLVIELDLWDDLIKNKTLNKYDTRIKYSPQYFKESLEEYFKSPDARLSDYKHYKLLRARFGSFQNAIEKIGANVDLQKNKKNPSPKLEKKDMRDIYKEFFFTRLKGNVEKNFEKRTIILNEFKTTKNALESLDLYCLSLLEKINTIIIKNRDGKMTQKEINFVNNLQQQIKKYVADNY